MKAGQQKAPGRFRDPALPALMRCGSEGAVAGVGLIDPRRFSQRQETGDDHDRLLGRALVPRDVHVGPLIDVRVTGDMDLRSAGRIVGLVEGQRARLENDQAGTGMAVPAERAARRNTVLDDRQA